MPSFPRLFSPIRLRSTEIRNRILSTGHQTYLARGGLPAEDFVAYEEARAKGGVGLIIVTAREKAEALLEELAARGGRDARVIGEIVPGEPPSVSYVNLR